jgi:ATP-dependent Clp protease ATP-binding subunit ClpC
MHLRGTDAAKERLLAVGWDPEYGARPLRRAVQREVLNRLASMILAREVKEGDDLVLDTRPDGGLEIRAGDRMAEG